MKTAILSFLGPFLVLWQWFFGASLANAREAHLKAVRTQYRASAEVAYHDQLAYYFDQQARTVDPHEDWHLFAQLKDKWQEHVDERTLEKRKLRQAQGKLQASETRLSTLEKAP